MNFYSIRFVDVIHTDSKGFYKGGLGMEQAVGHVDFYPNGGKVVTCMYVVRSFIALIDYPEKSINPLDYIS